MLLSTIQSVGDVDGAAATCVTAVESAFARVFSFGDRDGAVAVAACVAVLVVTCGGAGTGAGADTVAGVGTDAA